MKKINRLKNFIEHLVNDVNLSIVSSFLDWFMDKLELHFLKPAPDFKFSKGDVVFVDLGWNVGSELNKNRPCVIYSCKKANFGQTVVVIPLRSVKKNSKKFLGKIFFDFKEISFLQKESFVDLDAIRQISKKRISKKIGSLPKTILDQLDEEFLKYFSLKK